MGKTKTCPFCSSGNNFVENFGPTPITFWVVCSDCGACGPVKKKRKKAIRAWNKRRNPEESESKKFKAIGEEMVDGLRKGIGWTEVSYGPNVQTGWRCPRCDRINRPDIDQCPTCQPAVYTDTATPGADKTQWVVVSGGNVEDYRIGKITKEQWNEAVQEMRDLEKERENE